MTANVESIIIEIKELNGDEEANINSKGESEGDDEGDDDGDATKCASNHFIITFYPHLYNGKNNWIIVKYYSLFMPHINIESPPHICSFWGIILFIIILIYYIVWGLWAFLISIIFSLMLFLSMIIIVPFLIWKVIREDYDNLS
jgi:hypothetical protein